LQTEPDVTVSMWWGIEFKVLPFVKDGSRKILEFHFSQYSRYLPPDQNGTCILSKVRLLVTRWFENILVDRYDKLVVLTNEDKLHWNNRSVVVIPNALSFVVPNQSDCSNHIVISAGRLSEEKGFDLLIKIWSIVETIHSDWTLLIYGDGEEKDKLSGLIKEMGLKKVFLLPATVDLREEMLKSSIFAFTSRHEGFGMVLTEAMQCGLPIVSYDTKCGPRDIIDDNITGFLIKEGDEYSFSEKLSRLMDDRMLRLQMGMSAKQISYQKFAEDSIMNRWKVLFEQC
jgi:glycosyltransferase involved in cell wall biosynthesis